MATRTHCDWITTPVTADLLRGALDLQQTAQGVLPHRLPAWARAQCADGQLAMAEAPALRRTTGFPHLGHRPELPLPDQLHPDAAIHQRIGERFARHAFGANGPFTDHTPSSQDALAEAAAVR